MQVLSPGELDLGRLQLVHTGGSGLELDPDARAGIEASAATVHRAAAGDTPIYGVNTGFGKLASTRISQWGATPSSWLSSKLSSRSSRTASGFAASS